MIEELVRIDHYRDRNGKCPYMEWYESLRDNLTKTVIDARLTRLRLGNFGDCKNLGDMVFELRIQHGPGYRIYFGREGKNIVLLLCGGHKGSQKRDIRRAKKLWDDRRLGE